MTAFSPKLLGGAIALVGGGAILGALFIGAGAAAWGPRTAPMLAGTVMVVAGLAAMIERAEPQQSDVPARELHAVYLVLLTVGYILSIGVVGYILATAIAAPVFLWLFGTRRLGRLVTAAILCPTALHVFFFEILGIFPPRAVWDAADYLPF